MLNLIRNIRLMLLVVPLSLLLGSCTSGGSDGGGGGGTIPVTVMDYSANGIPNVTVVLGDSSGAMKEYGTTDANGQITFTNAPANATITAAMSCLNSGETTTNYSLDTEYDVNEQTSLYLDTCSDASNYSPAPLGTVTINVTNSILGVTRNELYTSRNTGYWGLITQQTLTITQADLQDDGKLSIIVIGKNANSTSVGYGAALGLTFTDEMTVNITVDQPMSLVEYQVTNMPASIKYLFPSIDLYRTAKGYVLLGDTRFLSSAPTSTTLHVPYIPDFADEISYGMSIYLDRDDDGISDASQSLYYSAVSATVPSNQLFDMSKALSAPSNLSISGAGIATPILSWSGVDQSATYMSVGAFMPLASTARMYFSTSGIANTRTSLAFPELPESLAMFRPTGVDFFMVMTSVSEEGVYKSSDGEYSGALNLPLAPSQSKAVNIQAMKEQMRIRLERSRRQDRIKRF